jgi:putative transcriptional regulator
MSASHPLHEALPEYVMGTLPPAEMAAIEREIAASPTLRQEVDRLTESLAQAALAQMHALPPPPSVRDRLLASVGRGNRLAPLVARLSAVADLPAGAVRALLDKAEDAATWIGGFAPGLLYFNFIPGPRHAGADAGFVRLEPGAKFPAHRHLGHEITFVLEGQMRDGDQVFGPGDVIEREKDSTHGWQAEGADPLTIVSIHRGFEPL